MVFEVRPRFVRLTAVRVLVVAALFASLFVLGGTPEVALLLLPVVPAAIRHSMVRTWTEGDRLHIRNFWVTYDLHRSEIAGFAVAHAFGDIVGWQATVGVQLVNGRSRRLSATTRAHRLFRSSRSPVPTPATEIRDQLEAWRSAGA